MVILTRSIKLSLYRVLDTTQTGQNTGRKIIAHMVEIVLLHIYVSILNMSLKLYGVSHLL